jgi:hypothetical protein
MYPMSTHSPVLRRCPAALDLTRARRAAKPALSHDDAVIHAIIDLARSALVPLKPTVDGAVRNPARLRPR